MTRSEAEEKAQIIDFQGGYTIELVSKIYDDFEEQLDMEKRKAYLDGSNDCFKALKEAGKLK